jgi:hypothetical protein
MGDTATSTVGSSVKVLRCDACGALLATTRVSSDLFAWARDAHRWTHFGIVNLCDRCS